MGRIPEHPVDRQIRSMPKRDRRIAERLVEEGFSDEDLYAALSPSGAADLLRKPNKKEQAK